MFIYTPTGVYDAGVPATSVFTKALAASQACGRSFKFKLL